MSSVPAIPLKKLNNGVEIPVLGFGTGTTWYKPDRFSAYNPEAVDQFTAALKAGYRHIDTAEGYGTEAELAEAIRRSGVPRGELFLTSKVANTLTEGKIEDLPAALDKTLERLETDYLDLYLLHTPYLRDNKYSAADVAAAWRLLESLQRAGKVRAIGVSNFRRHHVEELLRTAEIVPAENQIQFNPYLGGAPAYAGWLAGRGIAVSSYMGLAPISWLKGMHLGPLLGGLADKYGVCEAAVLIRWQLDLGAVVLNTSKRADRFGDYFAALGIGRLSDEDREEITRVGQEKHVRIPVGALWDGDEHGPYE